MQTQSTTLSPYQATIAKARERFDSDTADHEMTVIHDDGIYRHLRFQKPGTYTYGYDIVTWPGFLAYTGDMGEFMFSRLPDMFAFFASETGSINPDYWGEKLKGPGRDGHLTFSVAAYRACVNEWYDQQAEELSADDARALRQAVDDALLGGDPFDEREAVEWMRDFKHAGMTIYDPWDYNLREHDGRFLWCCWALVRGIAQYRKREGDSEGIPGAPDASGAT